MLQIVTTPGTDRARKETFEKIRDHFLFGQSESRGGTDLSTEPEHGKRDAPELMQEDTRRRASTCVHVYMYMCTCTCVLCTAVPLYAVAFGHAFGTNKRTITSNQLRHTQSHVSTCPRKHAAHLCSRPRTGLAHIVNHADHASSLPSTVRLTDCPAAAVTLSIGHAAGDTSRSIII